jgi:hypothetical protein
MAPGSTVVEHSTHVSKIEGSNRATERKCHQKCSHENNQLINDSIFYKKKEKNVLPQCRFSDHCDGWGSRCQSNVSCNLFSKKEERSLKRKNVTKNWIET